MKQTYDYARYGKIDLYKKIDDLFFMCDILGFSDYVSQNEENEVYDFFMNQLMSLIILTNNMENDSALNSKIHKDKLGEEWIKSVKLNAKIISDTFIIYPIYKKIENKEQYEYLILLLCALSNTLYTFLLNLNNDIMLRGVIMEGNYAYTEEHNVILGKGIIEAYQIEKAQNWSGIIIHPKLHKKIRSSSLYNFHMTIDYMSLPLKDNITTLKYRNTLAKMGLSPCVINWVPGYETQFGPILDDFWYAKVDRVLNSESQDKKSAVEKILNTKKFYDFISTAEYE